MEKHMRRIDKIKNSILETGIQLNPKLDKEEIVEFQELSKIKLPEDYVIFLTEVGSGGHESNCLLPLDKWDLSYYISKPNIYEHLKAPCLIRTDIPNSKNWINELGIDEPAENWDNEKWDPMFGTMSVCDYGCGAFYSMIVNGKFSGRLFVWGDYVNKPPHFLRDYFFLDWIEYEIDLLKTGKSKSVLKL